MKTTINLIIALCMCILYALFVQGAGVGGPTAGYMYIIEYNYSITQTPIDTDGLGNAKVLIHKNIGGYNKQSLAVSSDSLYWMAAPSPPSGWSDYCIYQFSMKSNEINILACNLVQGEINWPHNLYFSDELNTLYWTANSDDEDGMGSTLYFLNEAGEVDSFIKNQPLWAPSGLAVTRDHHGEEVIAENTVGPVNQPLTWGEAGIYTWPYKQDATQTFFAGLQPYNSKFKEECSIYFPGPVDIVYVDYNKGSNYTELYFSTIYGGETPKDSPMFLISKVDLYSPLDRYRPVPQIVLNWTPGTPDSISVDPVNQQMYVSYFRDYTEDPDVRQSVIGKVDLSAKLPAPQKVLSKEFSSTYSLENMAIRAV